MCPGIETIRSANTEKYFIVREKYRDNMKWEFDILYALQKIHQLVLGPYHDRTLHDRKCRYFLDCGFAFVLVSGRNTEKLTRW